MIFVLSALYSYLSSFKLPNVILWTIVFLAVGQSLSNTTNGWGMYHYYINSKYFSELGYFELYDCTVKALGEYHPRRNLSDYSYSFSVPTCEAEFSPQRWQAFKDDINRTKFYPQSMVDKGYNGSPSYTAIFGGLANLGIITPENAHLIDIVALVVAVVMCGYYIGWTRTAYIVLFIATYYGTLDRIWGHYAQWVWLSLVLVGCSLLERKNSAGALMIGIASGLVIFPIFLMLRYLNLKNVIIFMVALSTTLTIGIANGKDLDGYTEFIHNMTLHSSYVRTELCCNVGLSHTVAWSQNPHTQYLNCFGDISQCKQDYSLDWTPAIWLALIPLVSTTPLGVLFGFMSLSVYYWLVLAVIPIWYGVKWSRRLMLLNVFLILSVFVWRWDAYAHRDWLYFGFFIWLGVSNVRQALSVVVAHQNTGIYSKVTARFPSFGFRR